MPSFLYPMNWEHLLPGPNRLTVGPRGGAPGFKSKPEQVLAVPKFQPGIATLGSKPTERETESSCARFGPQSRAATLCFKFHQKEVHSFENRLGLDPGATPVSSELDCEKLFLVSKSIESIDFPLQTDEAGKR